MELAERVSNISPSQTLAITAKAKAMAQNGEKVVNFAAGEPDFDTPEHIKATAMGSLDAGFTKYTPSAGIPELREAISQKLEKENLLEYSPEQIVVTCGAKHALYNALLAVIDPGDEVLIPSPYWLSYPEMVRLAGGVPVFIETTPEDGYKITPEQFREHMSPLTKMIIINSPSNPTGVVYTENELAALAEVALDEEILILSDEIYEKMVYDGAQHHSIASFSKQVYNLTLTVNGFSKAYSMTGWRLGYVAAPKEIAKKIVSIQAHTVSHPTSFAQHGALAAYKGPQDCVEEMVEEYAKRRTRMISLLDTMHRISYVKPQGAFYTFVNVAQMGMNSGEFAEKLLEEQKVAVIPGNAFGDDLSIRLSYATSLDQIEEGMKRFDKFCS